MRFFAFLLFSIITSLSLVGQITCSSEDTIQFEKKIRELRNLHASNAGDSLINIGRSFLNTPYVEKTLEIGESESLVVNLRGFDCTTFVENVLAFGNLISSRDSQFSSFVKWLETIRYRNGEVNGYSSRLHYFTDWIRNNEKKGLLKNISGQLGGEIVNKRIDFMGTHRSLYPFLESEVNYNEILSVESELANESLCIIPQDKIQIYENDIQNGDIIALATSIKGLDVTHTGIAIRKNGRVHLLHASISGSVTITEEPLVDYLKKIKSNIGIIVARPVLLSSQTP